MDHVRDLVVGQGAFDGREIGDVAGDELHAGELVGLDDKLEAPSVAAKIERDDRDPFADRGPARSTRRCTRGHR